MGVRADEHVDAENFTVQGTGAGNVRTRIGATAYHLFTNPKTGRAIKPYLTLNWYHDTKNFGVVYDGVKDHIVGTRNFGEVKFGIEGKVSKNVNLWGAALFIRPAPTATGTPGRLSARRSSSESGKSGFRAEPRSPASQASWRKKGEPVD